MSILILVGLGVIAYAAYRELRMRAARRPARRAETPLPAALTPRSSLTGGLTDPRKAAAILLVRQAQLEGQVTPEHKSVITTMMRSVFGADEGEAEGLYSFGRAGAGQLAGDAGAVRGLLRPILEACTLAEMKDLAGMLEQVGETGGPMNEAQRDLLASVRRGLRLREPADED